MTSVSSDWSPESMVSDSLSDLGLIFFVRFGLAFGSGFRFFADFRDFSSLGRFFDGIVSLTDVLDLKYSNQTNYQGTKTNRSFSVCLTTAVIWDPSGDEVIF